MNLIDDGHMNNVVTKSNVLIEANYKLTLTEQKIVLFLVSKIRKKDQDFQVYRLPVKEFCELIGLKGTPKYTELRKITKNLMGKVMEIKEGKKTKQLSWISYVEYDEEAGAVLVSFDPRLKPYLLELQKEFTSYRLKNVMALKSNYSIRIYEILKKWEIIKNITLSLSELRRMLGVDNKYMEYHNFKKRVLNTAQKELEERTDIRFEFEEIKLGKKVNKIRFLIHTHKKITNEDKSLKSKEKSIDEINRLTSKYGYKVNDKIINKWKILADQKWEENSLTNLLILIDEASKNNEIENRIGFITYMLKLKNESEVSESQELEIIQKVKTLFKETHELIPSFLATTKVVEFLKENYRYSDEKALTFWSEYEKDIMTSIEKFAKKNIRKR